MIPRRASLGCLLCALSLLSVASAHAQMYKWVDERGVVNYSNEPPKNVAKKLEPLPDRVSVYSTKPDVTAAAAPVRAERSEVLRDRLELLERELELERRQRALATEDEAQRRRRAYEQCVLNRGVDCEADDRPRISPAVVVVPQARRPQIVPTLPLPETSRPSRERRLIRDERFTESSPSKALMR